MRKIRSAAVALVLGLASWADERGTQKVPMASVNDAEEEKPFWAIAQTFADGFTEADIDKMLSVCTQTVTFGDFGQPGVGREEFKKAFKELFVEGDFKGSRIELNEAQMQIYDDLAIVYDLRIWEPPDFWGRLELYIRQEDGVWRIDRMNGY